MTDFESRERRTTSATISVTEAQARLRAFLVDYRDEVEDIARELSQLWAGDIEREQPPGPCQSGQGLLQNVVHAWLQTVLLQERGAPSSPWDALPITVRQGLLVRGFVLARRRLLRACAVFDRDLIECVLEALDTEFDRAIEVNERTLLERQAALERFAELGQLVASVGHELRNPLSAIEASAYILSRRIESSAAGDCDVAKHLVKIRRNVDAASRIANALLNWAKQQTPRYTKTQLRACIDPMLQDLNCPLGVRIELDISEQLELWVDVNLLAVLLRNLVSNAVESLDGRGIIRISARQDEAGTSIVVSDDGPGVAEPDRSRIFEPLHSSKRYGTGLGLTLCRRIAVAHGGSLILDSGDCGASFRLWLPSHAMNDEARNPDAERPPL